MPRLNVYLFILGFIPRLYAVEAIPRLEEDLVTPVDGNRQPESVGPLQVVELLPRHRVVE
jgi:hypothetical protein